MQVRAGHAPRCPVTSSCEGPSEPGLQRPGLAPGAQGTSCGCSPLSPGLHAEEGRPHLSIPHSLVSPQGPRGITALSVGADSLGKSYGPLAVRVMRVGTGRPLLWASLLRSQPPDGLQGHRQQDPGLQTTPWSRQKHGPREAHAVNPGASHRRASP